jgi:hypothetical protein
MSEMQQFYETYIAAEQPNGFSQLTQANPEDIQVDEFLEWMPW